MWHGAYLAWLDEARVEALGSAGPPYHRLASQGVELPVVSLLLEYRKPLLLGDSVLEVRSRLLPRCGPRLRSLSQLLSPRGGLAAEAEVVLTAMIQGPEVRGQACSGDFHLSWSRLFPSSKPDHRP